MSMRKLVEVLMWEIRMKSQRRYRRRRERR